MGLVASLPMNDIRLQVAPERPGLGVKQYITFTYGDLTQAQRQGD